MRPRPADPAAALRGRNRRYEELHELRSIRPAPRRWRLVGAIGLTVIGAVCLPAIALASWGWTGTLPSGFNGACPFYNTKGSCSPSSSWSQNNVSDQGGDTAHAGFETSSAIRGIYLAEYASATLYESSYFTSGASVRGEMTWCIDPSYCSLGYSGVWFQVS
jgi:hypothetical protein